MRKLFLMFFALTATAASAQISQQTLGMKMGGGNWFTFEFAYQVKMTSKTRMEFGLGILSGTYCADNHWRRGYYDRDYNYYYDYYHKHGAGVSLAAAYHWVIPIDGGFNWFIGPGARIGSKNEAFLFGVGPQAGAEYRFKNIPLELVADLRTGVGINRDAFHFWDMMFGARYAF